MLGDRAREQRPEGGNHCTVDEVIMLSDSNLGRQRNRTATCSPWSHPGSGISPAACSSGTTTGLPSPPRPSCSPASAGVSSPVRMRRFAEAVDLAAVLTLDRVLEQVLGPDASARDPRANEAAAPLAHRAEAWLPHPPRPGAAAAPVTRTDNRIASRAYLRRSASRAAQPLPDWPGESRRSGKSSVWSSASSWLDPASELVRIARATSRSSKIRRSVTE